MLKHTLITLILFFIAALSGMPQTPLFYGTTTRGGTTTNSYGTIFTFNPADNSENVVWNFGFSTDGRVPWGNLVSNSSGTLFYATTINGGVNPAGGTIISFDPATSRDSVLWSFGSGTDGSAPGGSLVYDAGNGLYYGTTVNGGTHDLGGFGAGGTIFSFNPSTNAENIVWNFGGGNDGHTPYGDLVFYAANGLYYGLTFAGGTDSVGTIFSFNPATNAENVVWSFHGGADGANPKRSLVFDSNNGLFYGTTQFGGTNHNGTLFSFNPTTNAENVVWTFGNGTDGNNPLANLVYDDANGLFYGMTWLGGTGSDGVIFSFNPATNAENVVWNFTGGTNSARPQGNDLVYDGGNGLYYGMTFGGGNSGDGTIFTFNPSTNAVNDVWRFGTGTDGIKPYGNLVLYNPSAGINSQGANAFATISPNPTAGQFRIEFKQGNTNKYSVEVANSMGESIYKSVVSGSQITVNIGARPAGLYFVYLNSDTDSGVYKVLLLK